MNLSGGGPYAAMKCVYTRLLSDDELRSHLERGDSLVFDGLAQEWHEIEHQVERLGFGDSYGVSRGRSPKRQGEPERIRVSPLRARGD
jgi:hypothetical protein